MRPFFEPTFCYNDTDKFHPYYNLSLFLLPNNSPRHCHTILLIGHIAYNLMTNTTSYLLRHPQLHENFSLQFLHCKSHLLLQV